MDVAESSRRIPHNLTCRPIRLAFWACIFIDVILTGVMLMITEEHHNIQHPNLENSVPWSEVCAATICNFTLCILIFLMNYNWHRLRHSYVLTIFGFTFCFFFSFLWTVFICWVANYSDPILKLAIVCEFFILMSATLVVVPFLIQRAYQQWHSSHHPEARWDRLASSPQPPDGWGEGDYIRPAKEVSIVVHTDVPKDNDGGIVLCGICLVAMDSTSEKTPIALLPCDHEYHDACIRTWFRQQTTCPACRCKC